MSANAAVLATRFARRPLLLEPGAAQSLLAHLASSDPRGMLRESRLDAVLRRVFGQARRPTAQDHVDDAIEESERAESAAADASAARRAMAYAPIWMRQTYGEPEDDGFAWSMFEGIACLQINTAIGEEGEWYCGTWYHGYDTIQAALRDAVADDRVKGLFIRMNTPGGVVASGIDACTRFMREARAAAGGKPIHVYTDMACSAGYWLTAPADRVSSSRYGLVGSVGACIIHEDWSGAHRKAGLIVTGIQFGEGKTDFASWKALSARAREDMQADIDQIGEDFIASVSSDRPALTPEALLETQARVFMGDHANSERSGLALGFVDAIESEREAFEALLARVSTPQGAEKPRSTPSGGALAAKTPEKETPMATQAPKVAAQVAQTAKAAKLKADRAALATKMARIDAELAESEGGEAEEPAAAASEGDEDTPPEGEDDETDPPEPEAETGDDETDPPEPEAETGDDETQAIAGSAEAKTHPAMALTAIQTGMSLAQFKAAVATAGAPGKASPLAAAMAGSRRLGPDAAKSGSGGRSSLADNARRKAGKAD